MKRIAGYRIQTYPYRGENDLLYYIGGGFYLEEEKDQLIKDYKRSLDEYPTLSPKIFILYEEEVTWGL
jgi:hypothetical protein